MLKVLVLVACLCIVTSRADETTASDDDFYGILDLPNAEDSTERDIKNQFRKLSKKHHPDLHGEKSRAMYQKIQRAYEVLSDRKKRKVYDMKGLDGLKQLEMAANQANQPVDPFFQLFGGMGGGGRDNTKGKNLQLVMLVTLEDVYNGGSHEVKINKQKLCKKCRGTGADSKEDFKVCTKCKGSGQVVQRIQLAPGFVQQMQQPCPACGGKGKMIKKKCTLCKGRKVHRADQLLSVDIELGTVENYEMRFEMEADQSPELLPGDVIIHIQTAPHKTFTRKGSDLEMTYQISLGESLLGFKRTFTHLDGREVNVEEKGVVSYGQKRTLKGEGLPVHNVPSEKGDLVITYHVELPAAVSEEQRVLLEQALP